VRTKAHDRIVPKRVNKMFVCTLYMTDWDNVDHKMSE
jgi:hypothetical protein